MNLAAIQQDFRAWLVSGTEEAAARFAPEARAGLSVYQNNYRASLMACLAESFPRTRMWIGEQTFRSVAATLIDARPPDSWSLDHYAAHFPAALAEALPHAPEAGELAMLEQALTDAFVGPDAPALRPDQLSEIDWDTAILQLVPTARLLRHTTNAASIWSALTDERAPPPAALLPEPRMLLIWRTEHISCFRALENWETESTQRAIHGISFADLCARLVGRSGEAEGIQAAGAWLAQSTTDRLIRTLPLEA